MRRIKLTPILLAFQRFLTVCGSSAGNGNAPDAEESVNGQAEQTPDAEEAPSGAGAAA